MPRRKTAEQTATLSLAEKKKVEKQGRTEKRMKKLFQVETSTETTVVSPAESDQTDYIPLTLAPKELNFRDTRPRPSGNYGSYIFPCKLDQPKYWYRYHVVKNGQAVWSRPFETFDQCHSSLKGVIENTSKIDDYDIEPPNVNDEETKSTPSRSNRHRT